MKFNFRFPQDENQIRKVYRIQVVHGWMTAPFALEPNGTITPDKNTVSRSTLNTMLNRRVSQGFDEAQDRMKFRDKQKRLYKIEGKRWIKVNRTGQISNPGALALATGPTAIIGGPTDAYHEVTFKPMRKVEYTYSDDSTDLTPVPFNYPNQAWIPFVLIYTPDKDNLWNPDPTKPLPKESQVVVYSSNCHWYTDA